MKKIYFFNSLLRGGAAIAATNIFECVEELSEYDLSFFYNKDYQKENACIKDQSIPKYHKKDFFGYQEGLKDRLLAAVKYRYQNYIRPKYINNRSGDFELFAFARQSYRTPISKFGKLPDLIHLNWISEWIDYPSFFNSIPDDLPIVWTLHDMNPFTGGCHYSLKCNQYKTEGCKACYQLNGYKSGKIVASNWAVKQKAIRNKNLHIVGDSSWTTEEARNSILFKEAKSFRTINYSLNTSVFKPLNNIGNQNLNNQIPDNSFVILLGADGINNPRKGILRFLESIENYGNMDKVVFLTFGYGKVNNHFPKIKCIHLGELNRNKLADVYNLADLMVVPSLYEAYGLTAAEAIACGTPVIGFDNTGLEDIVIEGKTGWLLPNGNFKRLVEKIFFLSKETNYKKLNRETVKDATNRVSSFNEQQAYYNLYKEILM